MQHCVRWGGTAAMRIPSSARPARIPRMRVGGVPIGSGRILESVDPRRQPKLPSVSENSTCRASQHSGGIGREFADLPPCEK